MTVVVQRIELIWVPQDVDKCFLSCCVMRFDHHTTPGLGARICESLNGEQI